MADEKTCDTHVWASVGVVVRDGQVCRIWECEQCQVWTAEQFDSASERDWSDTWLSEN